MQVHIIKEIIKNKDEKALLTQITQIYSKIKARENSYSDTGNDSKLNKSNNQTEEAEDNKMVTIKI